jgi:acetaldehyde dehydrogenase/alcohol dehydrogenase
MGCGKGLLCCCAPCAPCSCSAIGDLYNFHLDPSLTLGCGSWGSTSVSANVGPQHLINIKTGAQDAAYV